MSKRKAVRAKRNQDKTAPEAEPAGRGYSRPWHEQKKMAVRRATKAGLDVERILFSGPLEGTITVLAGRVADDRREAPGLQLMRPQTTFLELLAGQLRQDLSTWFREGDDDNMPDVALELSLSFLYLFPRLWKALDKPLTLDEIAVLDFAELLSERRKSLPSARQRRTKQ